jgi:hypothetical protein
MRGQIASIWLRIVAAMAPWGYETGRVTVRESGYGLNRFIQPWCR